MREARRIGLLAACLSLLGLLCVGVGSATAACSNAGAPGAGSLPDCRAYELVSAVDKNGGDMMPDSQSVRVADDGTAVSYASLSSFGDSVGGGIAIQYMSVRAGGGNSVAGQGWATHGIIPPQSALTYDAIINGFEPRYQGELSPDLSTGVLFAWKPVTVNPFVANVANLYLRDDLRTPGRGNYTLISACPVCIGPFGADKLSSKPTFVGATPDFAHLLFESNLNLVTGANGGGLKLYEWERATKTIRLAGIYPSGTPAADAAGGGIHGVRARANVISDDGRRVFFTADAPAGVTNVYMRLDGTSTVQLSRSEAAIKSTPQSSKYSDANVSGTRVFFTSDEPLTDDATPGTQLYMYDTTKPDSAPDNLTLLSVDSEPNDPTSNIVERVAGASADGRTVYFLSSSQLVAGAPHLSTTGGLFVWRDGVVSFVSNIPGADQVGTMQVSPGGDLVYHSTEPVGPTGYDHGSKCGSVAGGCREVYVYRIATHELLCASCDPSGEPGEADAVLRVSEKLGGAARVGHEGGNISDDGRRVFFTTADGLVPEDTNGKSDAYVFDTATEVVSLLSSGHEESDSYFMDTTPSGDDAFFATRERLVGWDVDSNFDLYDARVGGGFPEPAPTTAPCEALACRGSLAGVPPVGAAASAGVRSRGNRPGGRCRRNERQVRGKGKVRCVKKHGRKRTTGRNRGAAR